MVLVGRPWFASLFAASVCESERGASERVCTSIFERYCTSSTTDGRTYSVYFLIWIVTARRSLEFIT